MPAYGAVLLALSLCGTAYWVITEWLHHVLATNEFRVVLAEVVQDMEARLCRSIDEPRSRH